MELFDATGLLFDNRFESFIQNNWPFSEPEGDYCNPKELALAGLSFIDSGNEQLSARCVVCSHIITNLEKTSDPWKLHAKKNPKCAIITTGKPSKPDGYTVKQLLDIFAAANIYVIEQSFKEMRDSVTRKILSLNGREDVKSTTKN